MKLTWMIGLSAAGLVVDASKQRSNPGDQVLWSQTTKRQLVDDFETVLLPEAPPAGPALVYYQNRGTIKSTGRPYVAHVAVVNNPTFFSIETPIDGKCGTCEATSKTSSIKGCVYATNGGFFNMTTCGCEASIVTNGQEIQLVDSRYQTFAVASPRAKRGGDAAAQSSHFIIGDITTTTLHSSWSVQQLISGSGWLIRNGASFIEQSLGNSSFVMEKAPRTAVGVFKNGSLVLYQVDGEEDVKAGPDLYEMTELMMGLGGVVQALNLDGGGSSVSVHDGKVISSPTCSDTKRICERRVANIACVKKSL